MRVKTVPRHRTVQTNTAPGSGRSCSASDHLEDSSISDEEKRESLKNQLDALNVSDKYKARPLRSTLLDHRLINRQTSHTLRGKHPWKFMQTDSNNNSWERNANYSYNYSVAGPSRADYKLSSLETATCSSTTDNSTITALNLSVKDSMKEPESLSTTDDKFKDTFLYKIMTDPLFMESIQKNKQPKKYICQFCKQEFNTDNELQQHLDIKKDQSNRVFCCACNKTFAQKRYLRYHQRCHSERTKFTCDICTKKYTRLDNLTRHNVFHINPDKFSCTACEKTFARKDLLNKHQKCHDNKYRFFCEVCQKYFKGPLTLENHKKVFHMV